MSQNLRTVSDIANSTTHQQQCSRLGTDSLLKKIGECAQSLYSIVQGETPRGDKAGLAFNLSTSIILTTSEAFSVLV